MGIGVGIVRLLLHQIRTIELCIVEVSKVEWCMVALCMTKMSKVDLSRVELCTSCRIL